MKAALGLIDPGREQVFYDGIPIEKLSRRQVARSAALLSQSRPTAEIEAERLVLHGRFPYLSYPRRYGKKDHAIAQAAMEQVGISEFAHTPLPKLSGGTRQKAYIAMALAQDTDAVLLDEPNAYLDIAHQLQLMTLCRELANRDKAVVLVLHDLNLALSHGDQAAVLFGGNVIATGTPEEIYGSGALERAFGVRVLRTETAEGYLYSFREQ